MALEWDRAAHRLLERCDLLAEISAFPDGILRAYLTEEHRQANQQVAQWMAAAGMSTWQDQVGNQWGRYEGIDSDAPTLIIGSHLDTVPYAGKYDGILGVLAGIELVDQLFQQDKRLPFAIEVVGFCDEEGTRFGTTLIGSQALAGDWSDEWLSVRDAQGQTMGQALKHFGLDPSQCAQAALDPSNLIGFWEIHIEQGPVLESEDLPLGIVTGIAGAKRAQIKLTGTTGHAGTTPMNLRRDALLGAAEIALAVEHLAAKLGDDAVATVGQVFANPGAVNVIAGEALMSLDVRSQNDALRDQLMLAINDEAEALCARRGLGLLWTHTHSADAELCDQAFQHLFARGIEQATANHLPIRYLPSGAGHDAMAMAKICPIAMLFVRSPGGISHSPLEQVFVEDVALTLQVAFANLTLLSVQ